MFAARRDSIDHRSALLSLFDIVDTADAQRSQDRSAAGAGPPAWCVGTQLDNPEVAAKRSPSFWPTWTPVIHDLHGQIGKIGQHLRESEWLQAVRQRATSPVGLLV